MRSEKFESQVNQTKVFEKTFCSVLQTILFFILICFEEFQLNSAISLQNKNLINMMKYCTYIALKPQLIHDYSRFWISLWTSCEPTQFFRFRMAKKNIDNEMK